MLMRSGLYDHLVEAGSLIPHREVDVPPANPQSAYCILQPEPVRFISYPYEWSFSQLKDAALLTLSIEKAALRHGLTLKDASAYNIQFHRGRPILIDTLSFEAYTDGQPWTAYRQFCQHFLAPLALMAYRDARLGRLTREYIDGIPLDLASRLLPVRTYFQFGLISHIHLHASAQKMANQAADTIVEDRRSLPAVTKNGLNGLIDNLAAAVKRLHWEPKDTPWGDYYSATNYSPASGDHKTRIVRSFLEQIRPKDVWDLGGNTGAFSRLASGMGIPTVSFDLDEAAVEINYLEVKRNQETDLLPIVLDLTNPTPGTGWQNEERDSIWDRGPTDAVFALALIHHLAISNNVSLPDLARFFARFGRHLIVEFIPKEDSQVKRLLANRKDIFPEYTRAGFEQAFCQAFTLRESVPIQESDRILYWMEKQET